MGKLRFKAPVPPQKKSSNVNSGMEERVCPQFQAGWVPKAVEFLECYAGAINEKQSCSFKDNWTEPIERGDYPIFNPVDFNPKCKYPHSPLPRKRRSSSF